MILSLLLELCLLENEICDPSMDRCCPGLTCLKKSGTTDYICGTLLEDDRKIDEGIYSFC